MASALESPVARKTICRLRISVGIVIEMRGTNGSSPASGTPTTSRWRSVSDFWPGNSEAQWPSGPMPSSSRSNTGVPASRRMS
jgi:hypothetical protein